MKMWKGRFSKDTSSLMERFGNSLSFDKKLAQHDIKGSIAWAEALHAAGVLSAKECKKIIKGLQDILRLIRTDQVKFADTDEDIHMAIERMLIERIGECGAKLHTGRSRNDQVATDARMYVKEALSKCIKCLIELQRTLLLRAEKTDRQIIMPGYTHLQQAQPILLSHYWLSFFWGLEREKKRIYHAIESADILPLGSGALAGSGCTVDRKLLAQKLKFSNISDNSIDGVASRDFILETLYCCCSLAILCSRYAEDLIIWSSKEFGYIELDDAWSTGSSMMPQKKNPDSLELIRGKAGRFIGNYAGFASTLKGVGLAYYKDLQEDKEPLFDSLEQIELVLEVFANVIGTLTVNSQKITSSLDSFLLATDLADYLVEKGMPFRRAHEVVGRIVGECISRGISLWDLGLLRLRHYSHLFAEDVERVFDWNGAISRRRIYGGTAQQAVAMQIKAAKKCLSRK